MPSMEVVADNNPEEIEARTWLNAHKAETAASWSDLATVTDVKGSTLSLFATGKYAGHNDKIATKVLAYRDRLAAQAEIALDAPQVPQWYDTPTATRFLRLFGWAQSGKIVLIVTPPGMGKTKAAERFAARDPNVWLATMAPSTAGVATMAIEVARAIGLGDIKGSPQQLSLQIRTRVAGSRGLLIVDEAQELTDKALNELRGWHDKTGIGIVLMGNDKVVGQLDSRKSALAQISSRISIPHVQIVPQPGDFEALFAAWGIEDARQRQLLTTIGSRPGALREITMTLEVAMLMAIGADGTLSYDLLRDAARQRGLRLPGL